MHIEDKLIVLDALNCEIVHQFDGRYRFISKN